jgi:hypothetical protein
MACWVSGQKAHSASARGDLRSILESPAQQAGLKATAESPSEQSEICSGGSEDDNTSAVKTTIHTRSSVQACTFGPLKKRRTTDQKIVHGLRDFPFR